MKRLTDEHFFMLQIVWNKTRTFWDRKTFQIHCSPCNCFKSWCRQIKSFACLSSCNWLWHSLILQLERKPEGLKHMDCIPYSGVGFLELGTEKANLSQDAFEKTEQFVVFLYEKNITVTKVNEARQKLFSQWCKAIKNIPPTQDALSFFASTPYVQPIKHVWGQCLHRAPRLPSPPTWGWTKRERQPWKPLWATLRQAEDLCYELIHCACGCKQGCQNKLKKCKCAAANFPCTALCCSGGDCNAD